MVPNGWKIKTLGNFCEFSQGFQVGVDAQMDSFAEGLVRFVRIVDYTKAFEPPRYVRKLEKYYLVAKDDLVMVRYGEAGLICRGIEGVIANNLFRIKPKEQDSDKAYLYTWLEHHQIQISRLAASSTMPALKFSDLKSLNIVLPPFAEQRKIAKILSTWDKAISATERLIDNSKQQKKALMQQLLTGKKRLLDDSGNPFEGEWEEVKLGDVIEFNNGKGHEKHIVEDGKYIVVNSKYISSDGLVKKTTDSAFCLANVGDVLMVMSDVPNGKAIAKCFYVNIPERFTVNQRIARFRSKSINSVFLYYTLNRNSYYLQFDDGVKQTNLRKEEVLDCPVFKPCDEEQQKIASVLSNADQEIELLAQQLDDLKQEKKALMQQLLTGKRRVTV